jgi:hypothetical protein
MDSIRILLGFRIRSHLRFLEVWKISRQGRSRLRKCYLCYHAGNIFPQCVTSQGWTAALRFRELSGLKTNFKKLLFPSYFSVFCVLTNEPDFCLITYIWVGRQRRRYRSFRSNYNDCNLGKLSMLLQHRSKIWLVRHEEIKDSTRIIQPTFLSNNLTCSEIHKNEGCIRHYQRVDGWEQGDLQLCRVQSDRKWASSCFHCQLHTLSPARSEKEIKIDTLCFQC